MSSTTLIIIEGNNDVEILKKNITNYEKAKIVSFDFKAHKSLSELNIPHEIVENYLSREDEKKIDTLSVEFTKNWYKKKEVSKFLEYNNLNIGFLVQSEIMSYFFNIIKRIIGIKKMCEKEIPKKIISSSLNDIVQHYYKGKLESIYKDIENSTTSLYYDNIEIPISVGKNTKSIYISRSKYTKMKKIIEKFTNVFLNSKYNMQNREKSILLLDFNPSIYSDLLKKFSMENQKCILLNQRRPAIWNFKSLKIVKNSKSKILILEDMLQSSNIEKISNEVSKFKEKVSDLWTEEEYLRSYFSIEKESFWKIIENDFKKMITKRIEEIVKQCVLLEDFFKNSKISVILEWAGTAFEEKIVVHIAKKYKIPIFLLQHGTYSLIKEVEPYHDLISPYLPSEGVKSLTWGEPLKEFIIEKGFSKEDVIVTGSPRHDEFFYEQKNKKNEQTVLIAANGFMQYNYAGNDTRSYVYLERYIKKICEIIKENSDKKIIVKLHPGQLYYDIKPLIQKIDSTIPILQNQSIIELIKSSDVVISLNYSTVALDAMILQKPTLTVLAEKQGFEKDDMFTMGATLYEPDLNKIEPLLNNLLNDEEFKQELVQKGNNFVNYYLSNRGTASKEIANLFLNY